MDGGTRDAKPLIALAMGDPAGISPELTAKAVGLDEVHSRARLIVVGDRRVFNEGMRTAGASTDVKIVAPEFHEFGRGNTGAPDFPVCYALRAPERTRQCRLKRSCFPG